MFFPERIKNIDKNDAVLEIGPGGSPYPRADVFLEKYFYDEEEALAQRGYAPKSKNFKQLIFFNGRTFPFKDKAFDYVICSHVLEHVDDVEGFVTELQRISHKGYIEFPTIYYEFIYNFPEHINVLFKQEETIFFLSKNATLLNTFLPVQKFFYETLKSGYDSLIKELKPYFFQGFEWVDKIDVCKASSFEDLTLKIEQIRILNIKEREDKQSMSVRIKKMIRGLGC